MKCSHCQGTGEEPANGHGYPPSGATLISQAREVLAFLNEKANRNYQPTRVNVELIIARLKEGATVTQCKAIISRKVAIWMGTEMEMYLRPSTLFNATKFSQYQGELPASAFEKEAMINLAIQRISKDG